MKLMMVFWHVTIFSMSLLGAAVIRSRRPIRAGVFYTIKVERKLRDGRMRLSSEDTELFGKSPGNTRGLNIRSPLYFGGINSKCKSSKSKLKFGRRFSILFLGAKMRLLEARVGVTRRWELHILMRNEYILWEFQVQWKSCDFFRMKHSCAGFHLFLANCDELIFSLLLQLRGLHNWRESWWEEGWVGWKW